MNNCKAKNWTSDDLRIILLAYDQKMLDTDYIGIQQVDWVAVVTSLVERIEDAAVRAILLRLFRLFKNGSFNNCSEQIPFLLLNTIQKVSFGIREDQSSFTCILGH